MSTIASAPPDVGGSSNDQPIPIPPRLDKMGSVGDLSARSSKRTVSKSSKVYRVALEAVEIVRERDLRILELTDALHRERIRAEAAEDDVKEIVKRFKIVHGQKTAAVAEAAKWKAEMLGYQDGLARARRDLQAAHEMIRIVEQQRNVAEEEAREFKQAAIQLREEKEVVIAREAGRREGILEGLTRARAAASIHGNNDSSDRTDADVDDDDEDEEEEEDDLYADETTTYPDTRAPTPEPAPPVMPMPVPSPQPQPTYTAPPTPAPYTQVVPPFPAPVQMPTPMPEPTPAPAPAPVLSAIQEDPAEPILRVPPPSTRRASSRLDSRSETGSSSPIMSQFGILQHRASTSKSSTSHSRHASGAIYGNPMHVPSPSPAPTPTPAPAPVPVPAPTPAQTLRHYSSHTTLNMPISSREAGFDPDSPARKTLSPPDSDEDEEDESNENYTVTVQGPSRSPSHSPPEAGQDPEANHLLSAADAMRTPLPLPQPPQMISDLPPGFVASGFTPSATTGTLPGAIPGASSASTPVIPSTELMRQAEEDDSVSSGMSGSGLTTPPARAKKLSAKRPKGERSKEELTSMYSSYLSGSSPVLPPVVPTPAPIPTAGSTRGKGKGKRGKR